MPHNTPPTYQILITLIAFITFTTIITTPTAVQAGYIPRPHTSYRFDVPTASICVPTCKYDGSAYAGTGAILTGGNNGWIQIDRIRVQNTFSIRAVLSLPYASAVSSTLLDFANVEGNEDNNNIQLGVEGYAPTEMPTVTGSRSEYGSVKNKSWSENNAVFRIFNGQIQKSDSRGTVKASCEVTKQGCALDSQGFFRPGVWYDIVITVNSTGIASFYSNGSLIAESAPFRHRANKDYIMTLGSSYHASSDDGVTDRAPVLFRAVDYYNVSLSSQTVAKLYYGDGSDMSSMDDNSRSLNGLDDGAVYASFEQTDISRQIYSYSSSNAMAVIPVRRDVSLAVPIRPIEVFFSFHDRSAFEVNRRVTDKPQVYLNGSARFEMDAMNTPNVNGIVLSDDKSFIQLVKPMVLGGPSTLRFTFKLESKSTSIINQTVFACSAVNDKGMEIDRISLHVNGTSGTTSAPTLVYTVTRGTSAVYTLSGVLVQPYAPAPDANFGWYDVLIVSYANGVTEMYNYGILIATAQLVLPYPTVRDRCYLGRDTQIPFQQADLTEYFRKYYTIVIPRQWKNGKWEEEQQIFNPPPNVTVPIYNNLRGAIGSFNYVPFAVSSGTIRGMVPANSTLPVPFTGIWSGYDWSFAKPLDVDPLSSDPSSASVRRGAVSNSHNLLVGAPSGYANLGSVMFAGDMSIQFKFRLTQQLVKDAVLFDFGNGVDNPLDNVMLKLGQLDNNNRAADLVFQIYRNGKSCRAAQTTTANGGICSLTITRGAHLDQLIDIIIVLSSNGNNQTITVYMDGRLIQTSVELWSPAAVVRPYSYIGYSHLSTVQTPIYIYGLSCSTKSFTIVDVSSASPYTPMSYTQSWLNASQPTNSTVNIAGKYPQYYSTATLFAGNPFGQDKSHYDGTEADIAFRKPTPGLRFINLDATSIAAQVSSLESQLSTTISQRDSKQGELDTLSSDIDQLQNSLNQETKEKETKMGLVRTQQARIEKDGSKWNETEMANEQVILRGLKGQVDVVQGRINDIVKELTIKRQLLPTVGDSTSPLETEVASLNARAQALNESLQYNRKLYRDAEYAELTSVQLEPMTIGGVFTFRVKFRVNNIGYDIPAAQPSIVADISNGTQQNNIQLQVTGAINKQVVTIVICRGSECRTASSRPLDSSKYWLDVIITIDEAQNCAMYNWGDLVSEAGSKLWLPIPGPRNYVYLGRDVTGAKPNYLKNSTIQVFQWLPFVMTTSVISDLYRYDKPPVALPVKDGPWNVVVPNSHKALMFRPAATEAAYRKCFSCWRDNNCPDDADDTKIKCKAWSNENEREKEWIKKATESLEGDEWELVQFPRSPINDHEPFVQRSVASGIGLSNGVNLDDIAASFKNIIASAVAAIFNNLKYPDWGFFKPNLRDTVKNPFPNHVNSIQRFMNEKNIFSDKDYGTASHATFIQRIYYYEPELVVYNNAKDDDELKPINVYQFKDIESPKQEVTHKDGTKETQDWPQKLHDLGKPNTLLYVVPPTIMFAYSGPNPSSDPVPLPPQRSSTTVDEATNRLFHGTRLRDDYRAGREIKNFTLSPQERIIKVNSICNFRFEFYTNFGRQLIVGDSDLLARVRSCSSDIRVTDRFGGVGGTIMPEIPDGTFQYPKELLSSESDTGNWKPSDWNPAKQSEGPQGYCLQYMEGTKGGMWAWRWHWVKAPKSYTMYNMVFQFEAANAMSGSQPTQAIAIDLYNHGPIPQTVSASHSVSLSSSSSFSNVNTQETNWNVGVSLNVEASVTAGVEFGVYKQSATLGYSYGASFGFGGSSSYSTEYGTSDTQTIDDSQTLTATVPENSKVTATLLTFSGTVDIPYIANVKIQYYSGDTEHVVTRGIFTNVKTTSVLVTYSDAQPIDKNLPYA